MDFKYFDKLSNKGHSLELKSEITLIIKYILWSSQ